MSLQYLRTTECAFKKCPTGKILQQPQEIMVSKFSPKSSGLTSVTNFSLSYSGNNWKDCTWFCKKRIWDSSQRYWTKSWASLEARKQGMYPYSALNKRASFNNFCSRRKSSSYFLFLWPGWSKMRPKFSTQLFIFSLCTCFLSTSPIFTLER